MRRNAQDLVDEVVGANVEQLLDDMPLRRVALLGIIDENDRTWFQICSGSGSGLPELTTTGRIEIASEIVDWLFDWVASPNPPANEE